MLLSRKYANMRSLSTITSSIIADYYYYSIKTSAKFHNVNDLFFLFLPSLKNLKVRFVVSIAMDTLVIKNREDNSITGSVQLSVPCVIVRFVSTRLIRQLPRDFIFGSN